MAGDGLVLIRLREDVFEQILADLAAERERLAARGDPRAREGIAIHDRVAPMLRGVAESGDKGDPMLPLFLYERCKRDLSRRSRGSAHRTRGKGRRKRVTWRTSRRSPACTARRSAEGSHPGV